MQELRLGPEPLRQLLEQRSVGTEQRVFTRVYREARERFDEVVRCRSQRPAARARVYVCRPPANLALGSKRLRDNSSRK
jgi:hypothetical protein